MNLVLRPAAAADLDEAFHWYEAQRPGLGSQFLKAMEEVFQAVSETPPAYPVVHRDTCRAHVRRFPYGVFFRVVGDDIVVVACFHGKRNPGRWKGRS